MRKFTILKPQYRQLAGRPVTPPPPPYEPLHSPPPAAVSSGDASHPRYRDSDGDGDNAAANHPHSTHLADAAVAAQHTSPAYAEHARRASYAAPSPSTLPHAAGDCDRDRDRAPTHAYPYASAYTYDERPAKRARSEFYSASSPTYGQQHSRPATSHNPGWSYNVEHMADAGTRMYEDNGAFAPKQEHNPDKRLSDAQLLLDFFQVSAHTAQTPPSTAKRLSISQVAPAFSVQYPPLPSPHYHHQNQQHPSPHAVHAHHHIHHIQHPRGASDVAQVPEPPSLPVDVTLPAPAVQTRTPPDDNSTVQPPPPMSNTANAEDTKPKKHQGWPKGKPRGPRNTPSSSKRKKATPKPKSASSTSSKSAVNQLQPALGNGIAATTTDTPTSSSVNVTPPYDQPAGARRHSFSNSFLVSPTTDTPSAAVRAHSVPLQIQRSTAPSAADSSRRPKAQQLAEPDLICASCKSSDSEVKVGDGEHEREVRDVNKFYCEPCRPRFGQTTKVRKSVRAHTTVDYAGLNQGVLRTSDDNPEHHYIAAFKNGDIEFTPETFARMPPELVSADFLQKSNGFREPILIPGALNPRPWSSPAATSAPATSSEHSTHAYDEVDGQFENETVADDGQDKLDMVIPQGLTVRRVAELYGPNETVPVIDVKAQEGEGKKWTMSKWADYYEQQGEKPVRNVISLEVSRSRLGKLIRRPKVVRDMDLQDSVWREDDKFAPPPVQFYCLMSVADCFTDFHIDFGGSSVYYHIVKGKKVFFFIPPTKQNMKKYEDWCLSPNQGHDWLGKQVKECYRVDLYPGDTMLIPSGWIHAVWTPEDSLVIGGNFLTRIHYGMQFQVLEIEKSTKVAQMFRYPFFQKIMWLTVIKYLEEDPVPKSVQEILQRGEQFKRETPIYCEPDKFGHNSHLGPANYNRRYYPKHELEGLTDVLNYIHRTVMISLDKIEMPQKTRNAVTRSIPKGFGDPVVLERQFAMWIAWKRGNETIPTWAISDVPLPSMVEVTEPKPSIPPVKKAEREPRSEVPAMSVERLPDPVKPYDVSPPAAMEINPMAEPVTPSAAPMTGFLRPSASNPHITTPKTSQLGPKRVACDACRKRRIRCKHKDELVDSSKPGMHTIDLSGSYGISVKRRLSDHSIVEGHTPSVAGPVNGGPIMADVNGDPYALKSGRVKACADCRKSKRRCIHDEYGNVDPIKANEVPVPRGSAAKRRRISEEDSATLNKRVKQESAFDEGGLRDGPHPRQSLPHQFGMGGSLLQDIAFSAQQALSQQPEEEPMPIDPALQGYSHEEYPPRSMGTSYPPMNDMIISSIEQQHGIHTPMDGVQYTEADGQQGPSIEPLTPGPPTYPESGQHQNGHHQVNGFMPYPPSQRDAVRPVSSPVSPRHMRTASPTSPTTHNHNMFTTGSDFIPPVTPTAPHGAGPSPSRKSGQRNSRTPKSTSGGRRRDSKDSVKLEQGLTMAMTLGMGINLDFIDPNLDQASRELIKQLQAEEHGLRRRSRGETSVTSPSHPPAQLTPTRAQAGA
ncbi:JmjC domain-containing histone demethylation protein 1 [Curvularia kusanoi]|uniref:[histone H3]-dimethyl-L-lysine(36) demethylase n=1 Tax=Curvularia kusanoi TaxID=90978 RepID=A0A9P4TLZ8_CURKU|nr:JmjC domain-containing histone demethylation protein 1 [Curvularia kusanoi]